jgi:hypothetical protein
MKKLFIKLITPALQLYADTIIEALQSDANDSIKYMLIQQGVILDWYCVEKLGIYLN